MNEKLERALERTIELLENCKHSDKAVWFRDHLHRLRDEGSQPSAIRETAEAIRSVLAGMGSFSDLSLIPSTECGLSIRDAHQLQWRLVEELDSVTEDILR